ncbi:toxin-antitoxin system HicB family antitoxin [Sansalvadorimonas verongulae]|uniref:toxin-antitoxin system HicB family antitoxin n=1 Tax=Sansalvadorimonas verongulae TaxID=2172824 RepID=UPI001E441E0D|nr:toxin-antitoxin system HicB family antitoxin [Sansalvadorimonas verongulae]
MRLRKISLPVCLRFRVNSPEPIAERNFSGQFMLRILPELHRKLVIEAKEQGVSLNRYIAARLA